jgi:hypothetical protein
MATAASRRFAPIGGRSKTPLNHPIFAIFSALGQLASPWRPLGSSSASFTRSVFHSLRPHGRAGYSPAVLSLDTGPVRSRRRLAQFIAGGHFGGPLLPGGFDLVAEVTRTSMTSFPHLRHPSFVHILMFRCDWLLPMGLHRATCFTIITHRNPAMVRSIKILSALIISVS